MGQGFFSAISFIIYHIEFNIFNEAANLLKVTKGIRKETVLSLGMKMHAAFCQLCALQCVVYVAARLLLLHDVHKMCEIL